MDHTIQWNLYNKDTIGTTVSCPVQWNLYNKDTIGTTVSCPVQWNLYNKDTIGTTVSCPVQWNLYNKDTIGTTVSCPVQWNLYNKDTIGTPVSCPVQWNRCNKDTIGTTVSCPVYGGVLISDGLNVHMSVQGIQMAQQWCPVKDVAGIQRCPLMEVSLYTLRTYVCTYVFSCSHITMQSSSVVEEGTKEDKVQDGRQVDMVGPSASSKVEFQDSQPGEGKLSIHSNLQCRKECSAVSIQLFAIDQKYEMRSVDFLPAIFSLFPVSAGVCTYVCTYMCVYVCTYVRTCVRTYVHVRTYIQYVL